MREKLNENPIAQAALVGVLLLLAVVFLLGKGGGGEEEGVEEAAAPAPTAIAAAEVEATGTPELPPPGSGPAAPPAPPASVISAYEAGDTVVILFVRQGGIDDDLVKRAAARVDSVADVATFVVPSNRLARYVSIAQGVDLDRLPALVVIRPRQFDRGFAAASVQYGFQSPQSIAQAVVDARYHGGTLPYHP
jgi:hypothetical protein